MSDPNLSRQSLDIGRIIQETFAVLQRNFATFAILAIVIGGIPSALVNAFATNSSFVTGSLSFSARTNTAWWGVLILWIVGNVLQATIIYGAVGDMNDRRVSVVDSLRVALNAILPLIGIGILFGIAFVCGLILLIVPGIMLAVAWCVVVPVYVVERPAMLSSFGRSAELTRGNRWQIFALFVLVVIATILIEIVFGIVGGVTGFFTLGGFPIFTRLIVLPLATALSALISATGSAVLYVELRRIRDGVGPQGLAAIFD